jgi:hypothetical protein
LIVVSTKAEYTLVETTIKCRIQGGWQTSAYDKRQLREMAKELYEKWDEEVVKGTKIRIVNF